MIHNLFRFSLDCVTNVQRLSKKNFKNLLWRSSELKVFFNIHKWFRVQWRAPQCISTMDTSLMHIKYSVKFCIISCKLTEVLYCVYLGIRPKDFLLRVRNTFPPPQDVAPHHDLLLRGRGGPRNSNGGRMRGHSHCARGIRYPRLCQEKQSFLYT